jgi:predicted dehydrogenase
VATQTTHDVLVIGAGSIGERHIRCFGSTGRARVSFVEVREELRNQIAERYPGTKPYASLDAALEQRFDAALIATPAQMHITQATQLVERGIHVLVEKPLSITTEGVANLIDLVKRKGVVAGVAYVHRANPVLAGMREAIRSGAFGRPVEVVGVSGQHFPTYRPAYAQIYYTKHETGGGAVQDALTHMINAGQWLAGTFDRVVADLAHQVLPNVEVEDTVHVLARQDGNVLASYSLNQHQAPNEMTLTVICERGTVRFESHNNRWRSMEKPGGEWTDRGGAPTDRDTFFIHQANAFLDAVEGKAQPLCSLEEGLATLRVNVGILKSARDGAWVNTRE